MRGADRFRAYLAGVLAPLLGSSTQLLVNDVLFVGSVTFPVGPDGDGDLLQRGGYGAAEVDGAPACREDPVSRAARKSVCVYSLKRSFSHSKVLFVMVA